MPAQVERLLWRFKSGFKSTGAASTLSSFTTVGDLVAQGEAYIGASATNYTYFDTAGRQEMRGTARVLKDIWIPAKDFRATDLNFGPLHAGSGLTSACWGLGGSLFSGCVLMDVTGSIFALTSGSAIAIPVLIASANVTASKYGAIAVVNKPTDADTSGSITPYIHWTSVIGGATSNCATAFYVGAAYLRGSQNTPSAVGTSACVEYAASYGAAGADLETVVTTMPNLPSFGANDTLMPVMVGWDPNNASDSAGSEVAIIGLRLRYTASALGVASAE